MAVVSVTCRLGGLDAMVSQTLSSLVAVNGVSGRSSSRWPGLASGLALLRLAAVNGLQSCGPTLGIDSMQSVAGLVQRAVVAGGDGSLVPRVL